MIAKRQKRTLYPPGIASTLAIPILFFYYGSLFSKTLNYKALTISVWSPDLSVWSSDLKIRFDTYTPKRNYINIELTGEKQSDEIKLDYSHVRLKEIITQKDSINGIHFNFKNTAKYWSFVRAIDICQNLNLHSYTVYKENIWALYEPPVYPIFQNFICGTTVYETYLQETNKQTWQEKFLNQVVLAWQTSSLIIVGYIILLIFSIRYILRIVTEAT